MGRVGRVVRLPARPEQLSVAAAATAFLAERELAATSRRVYAGSLRALTDGLGADLPVAALGAPEVRVCFGLRYADTAPATWNRELATLRSVVRWWTERGWLETDPTAGLARRKEVPDRTRALTRAQLETLWRGPAGLREKTLWRALYETAARANEVLSLDVEDLDVPNRRARVRSKGGATEWVFWQTGTAQLLPRLLSGRTTGPVFLANRRPTRATAALDTDAVSGRARLSYRRAAAQFAEHTGGWTLHQLRHSALTHAAEDGTNLPMLLSRSRHASVRSLERYARPGPEAVARHLAETDPARRRKF